MTRAYIWGMEYEERYVIEQDGTLFGPFIGQVQAHTFALGRLEPPYTLSILNEPLPERTEE